MVRGSIVLHEGQLTYPPPAPSTPPPKPAAPPKPATPVTPTTPPDLYQSTLKSAIYTSLGMGGLLGLALSTPSSFMTSLTTFSLAAMLGWKVIWG